MKETKTNKFLRKNKSLIGIVSILMLIGMVWAVTTITDSGTITPQLTFGLNAGDVINQASTRPLVSSADTNIAVPADYATIQEALNTVPFMLRHKYIITVSDDTYDENLWIPPTIIMDILDATDGSTVGLRLRGNTGDVNGVKVKSIHISSGIGSQNPTIEWLTVTENDPYSDENVSIAVYGSNHPIIKNINFTSSTAKYGIMAYGSSISINSIDFGNNDLENAMLMKHGGQIFIGDTENIGSVSGYVFVNSGGNFFVRNNSVVGGLGISDIGSSSPTTGFGYIHSGTDTKTVYDVNEFDLPLRDITFSAQNGNLGWLMIRNINTNENATAYVDDNDFVIKSSQDEQPQGGFRFDGRKFQIGDGSSQTNITLTSPDGSESCCGVTNTDEFKCSPGAC